MTPPPKAMIDVAPFDAGREQAVAQLGEMDVALGRLARRHDDRGRVDAGVGQAFDQAIEMQPGDIAVGDDGRDGPRKQRLQARTGVGDEAFANIDRIAPCTQFDSHACRRPQ